MKDEGQRNRPRATTGKVLADGITCANPQARRAEEQGALGVSIG